MRRFQLALCILALLVPTASWAQDDTWEEAADDEYEAYFGRTDGAYEPGPSSLSEAKKQGRGYRIGAGGVHSDRPTEAAGEVHVVGEGDTLWGITERYFEDPWKWPELWAWNPEITNPHWIYPLDTVRLSAGALEFDKAVAGQGPVDDMPMAASRAIRIGNGQSAKPMQDKRRLAAGTVFLRDQGYLERDALKAAGKILSAAEEQMFLSLGDQVYVTVGEGETPKPGDQYTVFRQVAKEERIPDSKGELVRIYGTVQVRSFDPKKGVARGIIVESLDVIERGFRVARVERRFDLVAPKQNTANVIARVMASVRPVDLLAFGDVVFLDVGEGSGIEAGNRFFVVRRGDDWAGSLARSAKQMGNIEDVPRPDPENLPKEVLAELRVVKVRKEHTIAVIVRSDTDLARGDIAEMRAGF